MKTSRPPLFRATLDKPAELVIDNFAGGGGASTGIEAALGRAVDIAINHSPEAIALHAANHPETRHYCENILEVDPQAVCGGRSVGLAWFSPDCTHFSRAKGRRPLKKEIRGLAWVVVRWAREVRPRVIVLENVEEFQTWGPLSDDGRPLRGSIGRTFREWLTALTELGYVAEYQTLMAADYGTPTTRKRLFLIARCDGRPIIWPEPTHGKHRALAWRTASEIVDWAAPVTSIFDRDRPLAEPTLRRVALGMQRYVFPGGVPFIIPLTHAGAPRVHSIHEPTRTITAAHRGELGLVRPFLVRHGHYSTITGAGLLRGRGAGTFRGQHLQLPLATVCATNDKHLVWPIVTKHRGRAQIADRAAQVAAFLGKYLSRQPATGLLFGDERSRATDSLEGVFAVGGERYRVVDIGMRMLQPKELFGAQGFPSDYIIAPDYLGRPLSKTAQIAAAGNSVCPQVARAIVAANAPELATAIAARGVSVQQTHTTCVPT